MIRVVLLIMLLMGFQAQADCNDLAPGQTIDTEDVDFLLWNVEKNKGAVNPRSTRYFRDEPIRLFQEIDKIGLLTLEENLGEVSRNHWSLYNHRNYGVATSSEIRPCSVQMIDVKDEPFNAKIDKAIVAHKYIMAKGNTKVADLLVVNVHLPLFVLGGRPGHGAYKTGLRNIEKVVNAHCGPVVIAGDFNGWTPNRRMSILPKFKERLGLSEIEFDRDDGGYLSQALKLDRVYYKDVDLVRSQVVEVEPDISDHHILKFAFRVRNSYDCP